MPERTSLGPRGLFITGAARRDEQTAIDLGRAVDDPRTGAVFLSLVNRLSVLEAALRDERLSRLSAQERTRVVVLDNEEAQTLIAEQAEEIRRLQGEIDSGADHEHQDLDALQIRFDALQVEFDTVSENLALSETRFDQIQVLIREISRTWQLLVVQQELISTFQGGPAFVAAILALITPRFIPPPRF